MTIAFVKIRRDGTLEEMLPTEPPQLPAARVKLRGLRVGILRQRLALSPEEFAARYHLPLSTLRDWEQNRLEPDQAMRAYLTIIARDPEGVRRILEGGSSHRGGAAGKGLARTDRPRPIHRLGSQRERPYS